MATGGPFAGLVGLPLGSRVLVQIPGQTDQQSGQTQPAIAAVVDLLFQTTVTPATTSGSDSAAPSRRPRARATNQLRRPRGGDHDVRRRLPSPTSLGWRT